LDLGVDDVDAGSEDRRRSIRRGEAAAMRRRVDAERHPAHDAQAHRRQARARSLPRRARPCAVAFLLPTMATDGASQQLDASVRIQHRRRIGDLAQRLRVCGIGEA
jgi:hypothetical protein